MLPKRCIDPRSDGVAQAKVFGAGNRHFFDMDGPGSIFDVHSEVAAFPELQLEPALVIEGGFTPPILRTDGAESHGSSEKGLTVPGHPSFDPKEWLEEQGDFPPLSGGQRKLDLVHRRPVVVERFDPNGARGQPTLAPHKAPHVLVEAWGRLAEDVRRRGRLTLFGPSQHFPDYVAALERRAAAVGARLTGPLRSEEVPRALAETDLLVVPSVWFENAPLAILEARATETPLLVSDLGGMAELVEPDRHGWRFRPGDADDLARRLERVLVDPTILERLDFGGEPVKDTRRIAEEVEALYRSGLSA